ncbi:epoxide hydrolase N-terminal domain-containing protein [Inquilinus sp.]|uniref:epoxide hydrolase N-terminal domain-containing protein n=1 Tax=Inquilinus sp. TaxID=1932117 RepID=UPI0031D7045A
MTGRPFTIHVPDMAIEDLKTRLRGTRWPDSLDDESWDDGAALAFVRRLADHWLHRFDWRAQEERLNRLPQSIMRTSGPSSGRCGRDRRSKAIIDGYGPCRGPFHWSPIGRMTHLQSARA